ncbi:MAG: ATP-binding protein [Chloroflexota bacterium]
MPGSFDFLREACQITGAEWAAMIERESGQWQARASHLLGRARKESLREFLADADVDAWLCGAVTSKRVRSQPAPGADKARLFAYPVKGTFAILLVSATRADERAQSVWRMAASCLAEKEGLADVTFLQSELLLPDLETDSPYNPTRAFGRALRAYANLAGAQGGWLAIRRGEWLDVQAQWNSPQSAGLSMSVEEGGIWRKVNKSLKPVVLQTGDADWARLPREVMRGNPKVWACFPLVIGQRLIGVVSLWKASAIAKERLVSLEELTAQIAPVVEIVITFASMADHMRRLAVLNDFAITVASAQNLDKMARRAFDLLARAFDTERAALRLLSADGRTLREYFNREGKIVPSTAETEGHPLAAFFKSGKALRVPDTAAAGFAPAFPESASTLTMPLRYRGRVIGALTLESTRLNAFSNEEERLLESLAGILASVVSSADQYERLQESIRQLRLTQEELQNRIEAQRAAESRLALAAKLAAVGEMAAGIAHELNNPLTTVSGFVELTLEKLPLDSEARSDLELTLREARRARDVVRRLLDFARQSESARVRADLNEALEDVAALTRHLIQTSGVELKMDLSPYLPWIFIDRNQIKQVALNLIHNALQAMPSGGELFIQTRAAKRDGAEWVKTVVRDTGQGILPEHKERLFEPFFTTKSKSGGTGLGLSVTYGIVTDHGGVIDVESEPGRGSTFTVWLPV